MSPHRLWLATLLLAGTVLAIVALRAREPSYVAPKPGRAAAVPLALTEEPLPGNVVRAFAVEGICCQGCGGKLQQALAKIDGVQEVAVDPRRGEVTVSVRAEVDRERLAQALTFDQYSARVR